MQVFKTISDLRATPGAAPDYYAKLLGYSVSGDGGGGDFYWDINDLSSPDNGGTIFIVPGATGRWKRLYTGAANVRWFGAKCDIVYTDDTQAIQNAVNACNDVIIDGISLITNTILLRSSNSGTSFTGVSKGTSGLRAAKPANAPAGYVLPQFDMLQVPAATAVSANISVSNIQLIFYGNDNFGDKAAIRILPGKTTSWMRLDNIDIIGSPSQTRQGTGLLIETVYSESTKGTQYYLDFANFTNFTLYYLNAGVVLNNIIDYPPDQIPAASKYNTNFINGNLFNTFVINDTITPVRIHTDASLDVQMTGLSNVDNNYFKNFIIEHREDIYHVSTGVRIEGGTNNVFDMAHFDVGIAGNQYKFSDETRGNFITNTANSMRILPFPGVPAVSNLGKNTLADNSRTKANGSFNGTNTVTIKDTYNVQSIVRMSKGRYLVTFALPMEDINYKVFVSSDTLYINRAYNCCFVGISRTVNSFEIAGWVITPDGAVDYEDANEINFMVL